MLLGESLPITPESVASSVVQVPIEIVASNVLGSVTEPPEPVQGEFNDRQKAFFKEWAIKDSESKKRSIKRIKDIVVLKALLDIERDEEVLILLKAKRDQWTTHF